MNKKEHLVPKGFQEILSIKASINKGLSEELKCSFPGVIPVPRPTVKLSESINPH